MTSQDISEWIMSRFSDLQLKASWGETSFFVNPANKLPSGAYFATLKEKDGENDKASNLDRESIFRLNFGPGKREFEAKFGAIPARPEKGGIIEGHWDFQSIDTLMPHPIYGWMGWMCILNPTSQSFSKLEPLLVAAYEKALKTVETRIAKLK